MEISFLLRLFTTANDWASLSLVDFATISARRRSFHGRETRLALEGIRTNAVSVRGKPELSPAEMRAGGRETSQGVIQPHLSNADICSLTTT